VLKRIELTNFMSHAHTVIEPAAGLTVLVGPNNCGKSAVVAALQILCHNENSTYVMRHGERECRVEVETSDGHTIRWERKNSPKYVVNGELFDRLSRGGQPEQLQQALRLPKVDAGEGTSFDIHFGNQKSPIFLLDSPQSAAAKFFASSSDAIHLVEMQRRHKERLADKHREKTRLEGESKQLTAEREALQPTMQIDHRLKALEQSYLELGQLKDRLVLFERDARTLEAQLTAGAHFKERSAAFATLQSPPVPIATEPMTTLIESLELAAQEQIFTAARTKALASLPPPPPLADVISLERAAVSLAALGEVAHRAQETGRVLTPLAGPPVLDETGDLERMISRLDAAEHGATFEGNRCRALRALDIPPELGDAESLSTLVARMAAAELQQQQASTVLKLASSIHAPPQPLLTQPLAELLAKFEAADQQSIELSHQSAHIDKESRAIAARLRELASTSVCPTCGSPLDADRLLACATAAGGHNHE
jgi:hypothetical protein